MRVATMPVLRLNVEKYSDFDFKLTNQAEQGTAELNAE